MRSHARRTRVRTQENTTRLRWFHRDRRHLSKVRIAISRGLSVLQTANSGLKSGGFPLALDSTVSGGVSGVISVRDGDNFRDSFAEISVAGSRTSAYT
jgi:hypothetical protein